MASCKIKELYLLRSFLRNSLIINKSWQLNGSGDDSSVKLFKKPCHILAEVPERCHTFFIFKDLARGSAESKVLVTRTRNNHMAYPEKIIDA